MLASDGLGGDRETESIVSCLHMHVSADALATLDLGGGRCNGHFGLRLSGQCALKLVAEPARYKHLGYRTRISSHTVPVRGYVYILEDIPAPPRALHMKPWDVAVNRVMEAVHTLHNPSLWELRTMTIAIHIKAISRPIPNQGHHHLTHRRENFPIHSLHNLDVPMDG